MVFIDCNGAKRRGTTLNKQVKEISYPHCILFSIEKTAKLSMWMGMTSA